MQPCHGDEGGGFTYYDYDNDKDILIGLFSASLACNGRKPAVYTPVSREFKKSYSLIFDNIKSFFF